MHYTQNERIAQVGNNTLVVGIDIGSRQNYARAFTERGMELSRKAFMFENSMSGFEALNCWMTKFQQEQRKDKIMIGFEPTGHYWFPLGHYLKERGIEFVIVAPQHVKHSKEMDDNTQRKDDRKDPRVIAKLVTEGRYSIPYLPEGPYAELRVLYDRRCELAEQQTRVLNRIARWFDIYFPEYRKVYGKTNAVSGMMILRRAPLPKDIVALDTAGVNKIWRDAKLKGVGIKRAEALVAAAKDSVGIDGSYAARLELWQLLDECEFISEQMEKLMEGIDEVLASLPEAAKIMKISGIGTVIAAGLLSEIGDIRRFSNPKQIQKLAGLAVVENSSGQYKGRSTISRRGRKRLRKILFQAVMVLVGHDAAFCCLHQYYTTRKENPLKKLQSLMALAGKLIRVIFGMIKTGRDYDPEKMLCDIKRMKVVAA
jgi:transposase